MNIFQKIFGAKKNIDNSGQNKNSENPFMPETQIPDDEKFVSKFNDNGGKFLYCENISEAQDNFKNILLENNWDKKSIYVASNHLISLFNFPKTNKHKNLSEFDCFLSGCEFLISNDGSLLFSSNQIVEKKMHQLPKHFIIVAKTSQIIKTISEGMTKINQKYRSHIPSNITTIKNFKIDSSDTENHFLSYGSSPKNLYLLLLEDL